MTRRFVIVVLGKQGSGKGTQCTRLSQIHHVPHVSTGDILRAAVREGTALGLEVKAVMDAGELVSDELIMELVAARLGEPDAERGALLDGCTRTRGQAEALERLLGAGGLALALNLDISTELVTERLSSRRVCQECGTIYRDSDPAAISGTCEKCGGDVILRADDQPDAIVQRLSAYERDTAPLLDYYAELGILETVNGDQSVADVARDIDAVLAKRGLA